MRRAAVFKPELFLLDISMPKLGGYDTCGVIRARPWAHGVRLVAVTGHEPEGLRQRSGKSSFDAWLLKPVGFSDLQRVLEA
ncbi:MAG: response regulator [Terrimicrobiaceae bacterium]|nr:response regulator [Terrimicrobiaceae bacterium]